MTPVVDETEEKRWKILGCKQNVHCRSRSHVNHSSSPVSFVGGIREVEGPSSSRRE